MNTLRIGLEYNCYPVWILDSDGDIIDNDLPEALRSNKELDDLFLKIQDMFDSCFVDTPKEFTPQGFRTEGEKKEFFALISQAESMLRKEAEGMFSVENHVKI